MENKTIEAIEDFAERLKIEFHKMCYEADEIDENSLYDISDKIDEIAQDVIYEYAED